MKNLCDVTKRAITRAGGEVAIAAELGLSQHAVIKWRLRLGHIPAQHVIAIERLSGIPRGELRPDLYPSEMKESQ